MTRSRRFRRIGCGALVFFWFALILLVPCAAITLISGTEITLARGDIPDTNLLRVWLIQQSKERGLGISTSYSLAPNADTLCLITTTRFVLWQGAANTSRGCECYGHSASGYTLTSSGADACQIAGL